MRQNSEPVLDHAQENLAKAQRVNTGEGSCPGRLESAWHGGTVQTQWEAVTGEVMTPVEQGDSLMR